jgi:hypothetical protein
MGGFKNLQGGFPEEVLIKKILPLFALKLEEKTN